MCGRFVAATDPDDLVRFFVVDDRRDTDVPPSYNVAPTDPVRAVVEHDRTRLLVTFSWGLVPHWAEDRRTASRMINARSETAADKPAFRDAFRRRRCIIPADGFYEWRRDEDDGRIPYYVRPGETPVFAFAGLWESWRDPDDPDRRRLRTCTILTTQADPRIAHLHPRMPVVLTAETWAAWLDRATTDPEAVRSMLEAAAPGDLAHHEVSPDVNTPRNNHPALVLPV